MDLQGDSSLYIKERWKKESGINLSRTWIYVNNNGQLPIPHIGENFAGGKLLGFFSPQNRKTIFEAAQIAGDIVACRILTIFTYFGDVLKLNVLGRYT